MWSLHAIICWVSLVTGSAGAVCSGGQTEQSYCKSFYSICLTPAQRTCVSSPTNKPDISTKLALIELLTRLLVRSQLHVVHHAPAYWQTSSPNNHPHTWIPVTTSASSVFATGHTASVGTLESSSSNFTESHEQQREAFKDVLEKNPNLIAYITDVLKSVASSQSIYATQRSGGLAGTQDDITSVSEEVPVEISSSANESSVYLAVSGYYDERKVAAEDVLAEGCSASISNSPRTCNRYCESDYGQNWVVVQRRDRSTSRSFDQSWENYVKGFGDWVAGYWMGLDCLHAMTKDVPYELLVELTDAAGNVAIAHYAGFSVGGPESGYQLKVGSFVGGSAGDSLHPIDGNVFTTSDHNNASHCDAKPEGGWWYENCRQPRYKNYLNGYFALSNEPPNYDVRWATWNTNHALLQTRMLIRRTRDGYSAAGYSSSEEVNSETTAADFMTSTSELSTGSFNSTAAPTSGAASLGFIDSSAAAISSGLSASSSSVESATSSAVTATSFTEVATSSTDTAISTSMTATSHLLSAFYALGTINLSNALVPESCTGMDLNSHGSCTRYCESSYGGNWISIQMRDRLTTESFDYPLPYYANGFGDWRVGYWMGLDCLHAMTKDVPHELLVELTDAAGNVAIAHYAGFSVGGRETDYQLTVGPFQGGSAGDSLYLANGRKFTTSDRDNDDFSNGNCAVKHEGGWWYENCQQTNVKNYLNGYFTIHDEARIFGVRWETWKTNLAIVRTRMLIRTSPNKVSGLSAVSGSSSSASVGSYATGSTNGSASHSGSLSVTNSESSTLSLFIALAMQSMKEFYVIRKIISSTQVKPESCLVTSSNSPAECKRYCASSYGGRWVVVQLRDRASTQSFNRPLSNFADGFGDWSTGYWLGLHCLHAITSTGLHELLVELTDVEGNVAIAHYVGFAVGGPETDFQLTTGTFVGGFAGDSMSGLTGRKFTTSDRDNDGFLYGNCAVVHNGGWWYGDCMDSNISNSLNGYFATSGKPPQFAVGWKTFKTNAAIERTRIFVREISAPPTHSSHTPQQQYEPMNLYYSVRRIVFSNELSVPEYCTAMTSPLLAACSRYCESSYGSHWLVVQRRDRLTTQSFDHPWDLYTKGFGDWREGYWMGLDCLHSITKDVPHELLVEVTDAQGNVAIAHYSHFSVGGEETEYKLSLSGYLGGDAGDSLYLMNGRKFTTSDRDNDDYLNGNCAVKHEGGWWYENCQRDSVKNYLNGYFTIHNDTRTFGVRLETWNTRYSLVQTRMLIRRPYASQSTASSSSATGSVSGSSLSTWLPSTSSASVSSGSLSSFSSNAMTSYYDIRRISLSSVDESRGFCSTYESRMENECKEHCVSGYGSGWFLLQSRDRRHYDVIERTLLADYVETFGDWGTDYWIGLRCMNMMFRMHNYELLVELTDADGNVAVAHYGRIRLGHPEENYELLLGPFLGGAAGDSFPPTPIPFTASDSDHDWEMSFNCAQEHKGAWWFKGCGVNSVKNYLNAPFSPTDTILNDYTGVTWDAWKTNKAIVRTKMMARKLEDLSPNDDIYKLHMPVFTAEDWVHERCDPYRSSTPLSCTSYCELKLGGDWVALQVRDRATSEPFDHQWEEYATGFGDYTTGFWLGLRCLSSITRTPHELLVELTADDGFVSYAHYAGFSVGGEETDFQLTIGPFLGGEAGDSLYPLNGRKFTASDRENDDYAAGNCAIKHEGGWWYENCDEFSIKNYLNSYFTFSGEPQSFGVRWETWKIPSSIVGTRLLMRPARNKNDIHGSTTPKPSAHSTVQTDAPSSDPVLEARQLAMLKFYSTFSISSVPIQLGKCSVQIPNPGISCGEVCMLGYGGNWVVIQRRKRLGLPFDLPLYSYATGFGSYAEGYWIGLECLYYFTRNTRTQLMIEMVDATGTVALAHYSDFAVGSHASGYQLTIGRFLGGAAGDAMSHLSGHKFSALDADNDENNRINCATEESGGWWYDDCQTSVKNFLNGFFGMNLQGQAGGVAWGTWSPTTAIMATRMLIREDKN